MCVCVRRGEGAEAMGDEVVAMGAKMAKRRKIVVCGGIYRVTIRCNTSF